MQNLLLTILATGAAIFMVRRGLPGLFCSQGFAHQDRGDYAGAERWFLKALRFERTIQKLTGQRKGLAIVYSNLGLLYHHDRRMDEAAKMLNEAIRLYSELGFPQESAPVLASLGKLEFDRGNLREAQVAVSHALELYQRRPNAEESIAHATALLDLISERNQGPQPATSFTDEKRSLAFTIPAEWLRQRLVDEFSRTGGIVAISHRSHRATLNVSVGPPDRAELIDKNMRATAMRQYLSRVPGCIGLVQLNTTSSVGGEANTVSGEHDGEATVRGTARRRRHGLISIIHSGLEYAIQWSAEDGFEDQIKEIVASFMFRK